MTTERYFITSLPFCDEGFGKVSNVIQNNIQNMFISFYFALSVSCSKRLFSFAHKKSQSFIKFNLLELNVIAFN